MEKKDLTEPDTILSDAKKIIKENLTTFFFLCEVGVFIIIYTDKSTETFDSFKLKKDFTTLKTGIITQGICIISSHNLKPIYKFLSSETETFGDCSRIAKIINKKMHL